MAVEPKTAAECPHCGKQYNLPVSLRGRKARCKQCHQFFRVPDAPRPGADSVRTECTACNRSLKVPAGAVGRRARCPHCNEKFVVPQVDPLGALVDSNETGADDDDLLGDDDLFAGLSDGRTAPDLGGVALVECSHCSAETPAARACFSCGNDPSPPAPQTRVEDDQPATRSQPVRATLGSKSAQFGIGVAAATVAGAVGAAAWFALIYYTNTEFAFLAWGIGGLVGFALAAGSQQAGFLHGTIAAALSVVSVATGKALVFFVILWPMFSLLSDMTTPESPREALALARAGEYFDPDQEISAATDITRFITDARERATAEVEALDEDEFWDEFRGNLADELAYAEADRLVDGSAFSDDQLDKYFFALDEQYEQCIERITAELAELSPDQLEARWRANEANTEAVSSTTIAAAASFGLADLFGWWDLIFLGLAVVTAFRIAAEGVNFG